MTKGSIELARSLCNRIAGELEDGEVYGSVDVAEILSAEVLRLERDLVAADIRIENDKMEIAGLTREQVGLALDAQRYRWLREQDDTSPLFCMYGSNGMWGECGHSEIYGELLDTSIDAALKGKS
jgi:hypothetical protein